MLTSPYNCMLFTRTSETKLHGKFIVNCSQMVQCLALDIFQFDKIIIAKIESYSAYLFNSLFGHLFQCLETNLDIELNSAV